MTTEDTSIRTTALHYACQTGAAVESIVPVAQKFQEFLKGDKTVPAPTEQGELRVQS